jgi:hypothetical protein
VQTAASASLTQVIQTNKIKQMQTETFKDKSSFAYLG